MKIIGLTGGIASGKNFVADIFKEKGAFVFDADDEVHDMLRLDLSIIDQVSQHFPSCVIDGVIDRKILGNIVFADQEQLRLLESIIHPEVRQRYEAFIQSAKEGNAELAVLNIPLLLETNVYQCDVIIAIVTSDDVQKQRFLQRCYDRDPDNFSAKKEALEQKFADIKAKQISNATREEQADFVISNDGLREETIERVDEIMAQLY